jgi:hypothetical protein
MSLARLIARCAALAVLGTLTACGGGGGGDDTPASLLPGVLRMLAVQGQPAPGTAGDYGAFPLNPVMDNHASGWSAFAAPTTDGVKTQVLYAAAPDGTIVEVYAVGENAPAPSDGTIASFTSVRVGSGFLVATVTLSGDTAGRTFGAISATLAAGGASAKVGVIYHKASIAVADPGDGLDDIDVQSLRLEHDGTWWFVGTGAPSGHRSLLSIEKDGTGLASRAKVGEALPLGASIVTVDAFSVEPAGRYYAIVADTTALERRLYLGDTMAAGFFEVMQDGDGIPGALGSVADIHKGGRLLVYNVGVVIWMCTTDIPGFPDALMAGDGLGAPVLMSLSGDAAPLSGGGLLTDLFILNCADECTIPQFSSPVVGGTAGVVFGTYGHTNINQLPVLATDNVSNTTAGTMGPTYIGLTNPAGGYREVAPDGSFLFANLLAGGSSAILWLIPGDRIHALAVSGAAAPNGDLYASLGGTSAHTVANGSALFRVNLVTAGTALMRQGP